MKWKFEIPSPKKEVHLNIKTGLLQKEALQIVAELNRPIALISDSNVASLHAESFRRSLKQKGVACDLFTFPAGEKSKSQAVATQLQQELIRAGLGRDAAVLGMGGGVVTDLAGFVASTYCRGIPLILIPTTLLASVDAAIGGKTGINLPQSKNFIGTIYQPEAILIDPSVLETLPIEALRDGLVEMIKHGLIWDSKHFEWIEQHVEQLLNKEPSLLEKGIADSCQIKMSVVLRDEHENGIRRLLNFGHTIAHALETVSQYQISHGSAVAIGSLVEGYLSDLGETDLLRMARMFYLIGIPIEKSLQTISIEEVERVMSHDKKAVNSRPRFVTLEKMGKASFHQGDYCTFLDQQKIKKALEWMTHDMR